MVMERGVVVSYDADRGFGFVRAAGYPKDVFVHVESVVGRVPLSVGQRVRFSAEESEKGPRAVRVEPGRRGLSPAMTGGLALGGAILAAMVGLRYERWPWAWAWVGAINPITFGVYAWDKHRATSGQRRVPEAVLHGLALAGGSPGAALAMKTLRHKTRKLSFLVVFWAVVALQVAALIWWSWPRSAA